MKHLSIYITLLLALVAPSHADTLLQGRVTFEGTVPPIRKELISKDVEHCGHGYRETQEVRVDATQGLRDVVVYLDAQDLEFTWKHPDSGYALTQIGCRFEPLIQIFPKDTATRLKLINSDPLLHNVRIDQVIGRVKPTLLNLSQPAGQAPKSKALRIKPGSNIIEISCDVHSFMKGWMFAADNPYCILVNEDGTYTLPDLPPGKHVFTAWHPYLGTVDHIATVEDGKPLTLNFTFTNTKAPKTTAPLLPEKSSPVAQKIPAKSTLTLDALPELFVPADNPITPEKVELGKMLFFDNRISGDASLSCSSCHEPALGWGDGGELSRSYPATRNWRNAPTIINAAYLTNFFWTGDVDTLEAQANAALTGPIEGHGNPQILESRLAQVPDYVQRFKSIFGTDTPHYQDALRAIVTYERTLIQRDTPFDQYMRGDFIALDEAERRGLELFQGKANCIQCHNGPLLTDQQFHNLGLPENELFNSDPLVQITLRFQNRARGKFNPDQPDLQKDQGLYYRSQDPADIGKFRTAPLRYTLYTPPYMHSGVFNTLAEVVDFYNQGAGDDPTKDPNLKPLNLDANEKEDLLAFLHALSGEEILEEAPVLPEYEVVPRE